MLGIIRWVLFGLTGDEIIAAQQIVSFPVMPAAIRAQINASSKRPQVIDLVLGGVQQTIPVVVVHGALQNSSRFVFRQRIFGIDGRGKITAR